MRHVREVFDSALGKNVFAFDAHRDLDNDRCTNFDRQRMEVKTAPGDANQSTLQHANGETAYYRWKFKLLRAFRPLRTSHTFSRSRRRPEMTRARPSSRSLPAPAIRISCKSSGRRLPANRAEASRRRPTSRCSVTCGLKLSCSTGARTRKRQLSIKRLSDGATLISWTSGALDTWRSGNNYNRGKWGIYRSLNSISQLRDETVLFADWCVSETSASQCPSAAGGGGGGAIRFEAESMTKTNYETNNFEGEDCARALSNTVGNVRATYTGPSGARDIIVRYHDENDGQVTFTLRVGGRDRLVDSERR